MRLHNLFRVEDTVYCSACGRSWDVSDYEGRSGHCDSDPAKYKGKPVNESSRKPLNLYRCTVLVEGQPQFPLSAAVYAEDPLAAEKALWVVAPGNVENFFRNHDRGVYELRSGVYDYDTTHVVINPAAVAGLNEAFPGNNIMTVRKLGEFITQIAGS